MPTLSVHPHARGDNVPPARLPLPVIGSPPRAWGQYVRSHWRRFSHRFTPTRVGTILEKLLILRHSNQKKALEVLD